MEANELVARLETRLKVIARIGQQVRAKVLSERETETTVNPSVRTQPGGYNAELITRLTSSSLGENLRVNLPKLPFPVFGCNLQQWQEFWDMYKATIHEQQTIPSVSKFSYLKNVLKGSALSAIAAIPLTSENYLLVVKTFTGKIWSKGGYCRVVVFQVTESS